MNKGFSCAKLHGQCKANCCGIVPIKYTDYTAIKDLAEQPIIGEMFIDSQEGKMVVPMTKNLKCAFLGKDLKCKIYDFRPGLCQHFGSEKAEQQNSTLMKCPYQRPNGDIRPKYETNKLLHKSNFIMTNKIKSWANDKAKEKEGI